MAEVHPTTSIDSRAEIAPSARLDRDVLVEGEVRIGEDVVIHPRVILRGPLTIGRGTVIYPGVCIGYPAQDIKFVPDRDTTPGVTIGERTVIREFVTIHAATKSAPTSIGDGCYLMVGSHIGHDCVV
ncbi:MAG: hypothetical protein KDA28_00855, partial [Phycisphaerales bacterium]|nr:hypothetical protein [Phycisphaerales bacterium]